MRIYQFKQRTYQAKLVSELLSMAEVSDGAVMFRDDLGQGWRLEKVEEVTVEESDKEDASESS